jgi:hypothetical protein
MTKMIEFRCLECLEELDHTVACVKHNMETSHSRFNIVGSDIDTDIKHIGKA